MTYPILYSLRNCPYAMRARTAIFKAKQIVILRDVDLKNKPAAMLTASPKGTVPILVLHSDAIPNVDVNVKQVTIIEESIEVMLWALHESDPADLLHQSMPNAEVEMLNIIYSFDHEFKAHLEAYKCAKRYRENNVDTCRVACEVFIQQLEQRLTQHNYLFSAQESLLDIALLPFIRQFARVERQWYLQSPYPKLRQWLNNYLQSPMFSKVMMKVDVWKKNDEVSYFGGNKNS
jgi:glutathione S-transferase